MTPDVSATYREAISYAPKRDRERVEIPETPLAVPMLPPPPAPFDIVERSRGVWTRDEHDPTLLHTRVGQRTLTVPESAIRVSPAPGFAALGSYGAKVEAKIAGGSVADPDFEPPAFLPDVPLLTDNDPAALEVPTFTGALRSIKADIPRIDYDDADAPGFTRDVTGAVVPKAMPKPRTVFDHSIGGY